MKIKIGENEYYLIVRDEGEFVSEYSNRNLQWKEVSLRVVGEDVFNEVNGIGEITTVSESGEENTWFVNKLSSSYQQGRPVYDIVWELNEKELLNIQSLTIGELELVPYQYKEEIDNHVLYITAYVNLSKGEFDKFKAIYFNEDYFLVKRNGINPDPIRMRFGKLVWSRADEAEETKIRLYLVDKKHDLDRDGQPGLFEPEFGNIKNMLSGDIERFVNLLKVLERKELLTAEEIEEIKNITDENFELRRFEISRTENIDDYSI